MSRRVRVRRGSKICSNSLATEEMRPMGLWSDIFCLDLPLPPFFSGHKSTCFHMVGNSIKCRIAFRSASSRSNHSFNEIFRAALGIVSLAWQAAEFNLSCAVLRCSSVIGSLGGESCCCCWFSSSSKYSSTSASIFLRNSSS